MENFINPFKDGVVGMVYISKLRIKIAFGRVAKNCTQVILLLLQNNMTQIEVKNSHPNNYLSKSEKVFSKKKNYSSTE